MYDLFAYFKSSEDCFIDPAVTQGHCGNNRNGNQQGSQKKSNTIILPEKKAEIKYCVYYYINRDHTQKHSH